MTLLLREFSKVMQTLDYINVTMITELELTTGKKKNLNVDTLPEKTLFSNSLRGGRLGKLLHCPAREKN